jgi:hypothetical protein
VNLRQIELHERGVLRPSGYDCVAETILPQLSGEVICPTNRTRSQCAGSRSAVQALRKQRAQ